MIAWALGPTKMMRSFPWCSVLWTGGPVLPDFAAAVQVHRPELADFAGPAAGKPLEADHIGHDRRQVGQRGIDERLRQRAGSGPAPVR